VAMLTTACSEEVDCDEDPTNPDCNTASYVIEDVEIDGTMYAKITGGFDENYTLTSDVNWMMSGGVFVNDGVTLTIDAGTTVYGADDGTTPFLAISQGAKIMAEGTQNNPIVFTTVNSSPAAGDWGGIIINGKATANCGAACESEGGAGTYGGTDDADNSGVLRYVRVEYGGKKFTTEDELNGFTFNGVGSGTTVAYVQAYECADDGFEFFGGTVNVKYAVSSKAGDDSFDWTFGWRGKGQFWVIEQSSVESDRGIEGDNNSSDRGATPTSNPTITNITMLGANDDGDNQAMKLREGTKGLIYNAICVGFPKRGVQVEHDETLANMVNGDLLVANSVVFLEGAADDYGYYIATNTAGDAVACPFNDDATNATLNPLLNNGYVGTIQDDAFDVTGLDAWFDAATYKGAVVSGNDWTSGWTK